MILFLTIGLMITGCGKKGEDKINNIDNGNIEDNDNIDKTKSTADNAKTSKINFPLKGITLTPKSFQGSDFTGFFEKAKEMVENNFEKEIGNDNQFIVSWVGDWNELGKDKSGPIVVAELAKTYGYIPLIELQFFTQSTGKLLRPLDETTKTEYKNSAVIFAEKYKPKYIALGIEVNTLYTSSPSNSHSDFKDFTNLYNEIYDKIKASSPNTKVFTIFQLEKMKGLNGGLFGGENNEEKAQWFLLKEFKTDIIAFTTYPGLIYKNPSEMPENYYSSIETNIEANLPENYKQIPLAFTEIGWHSDTTITGWESSEEEQAEFIKRFFEMTKALNKDFNKETNKEAEKEKSKETVSNIEFFIWSFMYDQNTIQPFDSMGLIDKDGNVKLAWEEWRENK